MPVARCMRFNNISLGRVTILERVDESRLILYISTTLMSVDFAESSKNRKSEFKILQISTRDPVDW